MSAVRINEKNFEQEVLNSEKKVLLDFWAPWCGPCQMLGPVIDQIADTRSDIKVCKVNVDEERALAKRYRVMSIPTLLVIENGQVVKKSVGGQPKEQILAMLQAE